MSKIQSIKKVLFLIISFIFLFWLMIMFYDYSAALPFFMLFLILMMEGIPFLIATYRVKYFLKIDQKKHHYKGKLLFNLCVSKKGFYPFKMVRFKTVIQTRYGNKTINQNIKISMSGNRRQITEVSIDQIGCGYVTLEIKEAYIYDALGFFGKKRRKLQAPIEIVIMPVVQEVFIDLEHIPYVEVDESDIFSQDKPGNDPSELFGVRSFADGDSLNKISWKLSAKMNETMVREFSMPVESNVYVYVDLYEKADIDIALQDAISAANALMEMESPFFICWFDNEEMCMRRKQPKDYDEIDEIICIVMRVARFKKDYLINEILNKFRNESHVIYPVFRIPT